MKKLIYLPLFALVAVVASCSCESNQAHESLTKKEVGQKVYEFTYPLPTAFEITEMLNRIDANYILDICNAQSNADNYLSETQRATNLGIYSADICYASTYNQKQTVMDYMEIIKQLIDELDMTSAVDPNLPQKIEDSENDKAELTDLITESFYDCYDYLNRNGRGPVSMLIVSGSWVEGLYLATHISEFTFDNKEIVKIVMSQKEPLENLMEILAKEEFTDNSAVDSVKNQLAPLHEIYSQVSEGGLSQAQLEEIKVEVDKVRTEMTNY